MSLNEAVIRFPLWVVSHRNPFRSSTDGAEFTTLKQTWQQSKATSYLAKAGETILPGFTGVYYK